jgi:aminocarboxymuconate-semialdehyde decarboxylase
MLGAAGSYGPEVIDHGNDLKSFRSGKHETTPFVAKDSSVEGARNPEVRAREMDELGIDVMGITISPLFYCYGADRADGANYARVCNDEMEKYCEGTPGRFFFFPTLPLQDIELSVAELQRVRQFKWSRGLNMATDNLAGRDLCDEALFPVYEICEEHDMPLFLHPAAIGTDDPDWNPANNQKDIFSFGWIAGYIYRESLAYGNLVLGGVLDRFPGLKICLTHGGGFVPYQIGRFAEAAARMPASKAGKPIRAYDKNFYFENSVHDADCRDFLVKMWGIDNIYTGSNYNGWDQNDGFGFAETMAQTPDELHQLWAGNSIKLFQLDERFGRDAG